MLPLLLLACSPTGAADPAPASERLEIPAGLALLGQDGVPDEGPARTVEMPAFRIDRLETSLEEWAAFTAAGGYDDPSLWSDEGWAWRRDNPDAPDRDRSYGREPDHPVIDITAYEAEAYCAWRGGRLPTEWEWERAARGPASVADGNPWPFGDEPKENVANWYHAGKYAHFTKVETWPVGHHLGQGRAPEGPEHMAGNVWEWTASTYCADPTASCDGPWRVLRGGSWMNLWSYCSTTHREPARPEEGRITAGVRCVE